MMSKTTKTKITQETTTVPTQDDSQPVVAFRVGQLEKRFDTFEAKLDNLGGNFVTIETVREMKLAADKEHKEFADDIIASGVRMNAIEARIASYPLVEKIVFTAVGLVLLSVLGAVIGLVILK